jgi:hypothetical protein
VSVPSQELDLQHDICRGFLWLEVRGDCSFCWYLCIVFYDLR